MRSIAVPLMLLAAAFSVWAQSAKPRAADPLAAVRARLRQLAVPAHTYVVAHPAPTRQFLNPARDAQTRFSFATVIYTPSGRGH